MTICLLQVVLIMCWISMLALVLLQYCRQLGPRTFLFVNILQQAIICGEKNGERPDPTGCMQLTVIMQEIFWQPAYSAMWLILTLHHQVILCLLPQAMYLY